MDHSTHPPKAAHHAAFFMEGKAMHGDYFTRLVAINALGPNAWNNRSSGGGALLRYKCRNCLEVHSSETDAAECCPPEECWECDVCQKVHATEYQAEACCPGLARGQPRQCPVCMEGADSFQEAADCCLHTHPTMTQHGRQRMAEMVEAGTPWPVALAANASY